MSYHNIRQIFLNTHALNNKLKLIILTSCIYVYFTGPIYAEANHPERAGIGIVDPEERKRQVTWNTPSVQGFSILSNSDKNFIDHEKSLLITNTEMLAKIRLSELLRTLVSSSSSTNSSAEELLTNVVQNICGTGCPRDIKNIDTHFRTIAAVNRFDLAERDNFTTCGEYRLIFSYIALTPTDKDTKQVSVIFETKPKNPTAEKKEESCLPVTNFWRSLTFKNPKEISESLSKFFFEGLEIDGVEILPAIAIENLGYGTVEPRGQIRVVVNKNDWAFHEYHLGRKNKKLVLKKTTVKGVPKPSILKQIGDSTTPTKHGDLSKFVKEVTDQIKKLSKDDINRFSFTIKNKNLLSQRHTSSISARKNQDIFKAFALRADNSSYIVETIDNELRKNSIALKTKHIVARIGALTCAGCHRYASRSHDRSYPYDMGLQEGKWFSDHNHQHVAFTKNHGVYRTSLSTALKCRILPHRLEVLKIHLRLKLTAKDKLLYKDCK